MKIIDEINISELPWLTDEAIGFLEKLLQEKEHAKILEFGCGGSTIWFSKRTRHLVSIEHDVRWYTKTKNYLEALQVPTVDLRLIKSNYFLQCDTFEDNYFDLILIDAKDRIKCTQRAIRILKPGGILMLDNAEREKFKPIYEMLKGWEFFTTTQKSKTPLGFEQENWQTNWWIKPNN